MMMSRHQPSAVNSNRKTQPADTWLQLSENRHNQLSAVQKLTASNGTQANKQTDRHRPV
jgi:hypothetical protein